MEAANNTFQIVQITWYNRGQTNRGCGNKAYYPMQGKSQGEGRGLGSSQRLSRIIKAMALHVTETSASALLCAPAPAQAVSQPGCFWSQGMDHLGLSGPAALRAELTEQQAAACAARKAAFASSVLCVCKQKQQLEPGWREIRVGSPAKHGRELALQASAVPGAAAFPQPSWSWELEVKLPSCMVTPSC